MRGNHSSNRFLFLFLLPVFILSLISTDSEAGAKLTLTTDSITPSDRPVLIYWHDVGLSKKDAKDLSVKLQNKGFQVTVEQHRDPRAPDSIFIGALVAVSDAQIVLSSLPYKIEYIFGQDYPEVSGGDPDGKLIGVGYRSTHMSETAEKRFKPVHISPDQLSSLLESGLSSTKFQMRLRDIVNQQSDRLTHSYRDVDFGNYHALIIGNNEYQHEQFSRLKNARRDARALSNVLKNDFGFSVTLLTDATRSEIIVALDKFRRILGNRDNLLIYYAGHGWEDKKADEGYWLPVDAAKNTTANWISSATITSKVRALSAKHVLVVSDSCYAGKLTRGVTIILDNDRDYFKRMANKKARIVMTSGGLEPVDDGKGSLSPFATAFIDILKQESQTKRVVDMAALFPKIRRKVMLNARQTPEYSDIREAGHNGGDFLFVRQ